MKLRHLFRKSPEPAFSVEDATREFSQAVMEMQIGQVHPLLEAARGMRRKMIEDGWPEQYAEAASFNWLQGMISMCTAAVTK